MKYNNLDEIDEIILYELSQNARISYVELSKLVNLSRVAIKARIKSLEDNGIIEKYTILTNLRKTGKQIAAFFDLEVESTKLYEIGNEIALIENVTDVYQMTGTGNLHVHAMIGINEELNDFLYKKLYSMDGVIRVTSRLIVTRFKARLGARL
ncbi:Lrp/AsnC family transcriptional regulator [Clostridium sp. DL1XJH146]